MKLELEKKRLQYKGENDLFLIELAMKQEAESQKLNKLKFETEQLKLDNQLASVIKTEKINMDNLAALLKVKD